MLLLNPDTRLLPGALRHMHSFLDERPAAGAAGPLVYWDDSRSFLFPLAAEHYAPRVEGFGACKSMIFERIYGRFWRSQAARHCQATQALEQANSSGHVLLRRAAVEQVQGFFDPPFSIYLEGAARLARLRQSGYRLFMLPSALAIHRFGGTARDRQDWKASLFSGSARGFAEKHASCGPAVALEKVRRSRLPSATRTLEGIDLGALSEPPRLEPPQSMRSSWSAEWSLQPDCFSAAGWCRQVDHPHVSVDLWRHVPHESIS